MTEEEKECAICAEVIDGVDRVEAVGACNHRGVCSICFLRMRSLLKDYSCPMCKTELEFVVGVGPKQIKQGRDLYGHYNIWGDDAGPDHTFDHKSKMFLPKEYQRSAVDKLRVCKCPECGVWKRDLHSLGHHVKDHKKQMCNLCIEHKKVFPSEHSIYTVEEYEKHLKCGDKDGSEGHPKCLFCKKRHYDKNELFSHLERDHYSCHICIKSGIKFRYYKDYESLESHFRKAHFLCEEKSCLEKRFVVFGNNIDYVAHMHSWHPLLPTSKTIPVSFKSYGDDKKEEAFENKENFIGCEGTRYDGGVGGRDINGEWQVLIPQGLRDPREASRRSGAHDEPSRTTEHNFDAADYPSLQGEVGETSSRGDSLRWGRGGNNQKRAEEYPALVGNERRAPLEHTRMSNWSARIKVDKKLSVRKPKAVSNPKTTDHRTSSAGAYSYSLQDQINQQLQINEDSDRAKSNDPSNGKTTTKPNNESIVEPPRTLNLAKKIAMEQKVSIGNTTNTRSEKIGSGVDSSMNSSALLPEPPPSGHEFPPPAAPVNVEKTKTTKSSKKSQLSKQTKKASTTSGWGAALSADGLSFKNKDKKKSIGISVVKKKSPPQPAVNLETELAGGDVSCPPPGFSNAPPGFDTPRTEKDLHQFSSSDFPAFSESSPKNIHTDKTKSSKVEKEKWTKVPQKGNNKATATPMSTKPFPGQWAPSIGGSGGKNKKAEALEENRELNAADFPAFLTANKKETSAAKKPKKSSKANFTKLT